jgi:hypothetical protein
VPVESASRVDRDDRQRRDTEEMPPMTKVPITVHVDPEVAKEFELAPKEQRDKIEAVLRLFLNGLMSPPQTLGSVVDQVFSEAEHYGLTPEILESILHHEDKGRFAWIGDGGFRSRGPGVCRAKSSIRSNVSDTEFTQFVVYTSVHIEILHDQLRRMLDYDRVEGVI